MAAAAEGTEGEAERARARGGGDARAARGARPAPRRSPRGRARSRHPDTPQRHRFARIVRRARRARRAPQIARHRGTRPGLPAHARMLPACRAPVHRHCASSPSPAPHLSTFALSFPSLSPAHVSAVLPAFCAVPVVSASPRSPHPPLLPLRPSVSRPPAARTTSLFARSCRHRRSSRFATPPVRRFLAVGARPLRVAFISSYTATHAPTVRLLSRPHWHVHHTPTSASCSS